MGRGWQSVFAASAMSLALVVSASAEVVYHRGNGGEPKTLDAHQTSIDVEANVLRDLYEGLAAYDVKGQIVPGAAESWSVSDDGTVWSFNLRQDGKWSNGDPVKASDFVFSFRRIMDPQTAAKYASLLYPIKSAEKINRGELPPDQLGVKAEGDFTVEIALERPTPYFLELLTHQTSLPMHQGTVEKFGKEFVRPGNLVSNGAFTLTENVPGDHIKVVKNPAYWDTANVKIDAVIFYPTEDNAAAVRRFMAGELDTNYQFPIDQLKFLRERLGDQVKTSPYMAIEYYALNTTKPPFDDLRVRKALAMSIDRDFLAEEVWSGAAAPAYSLVPPGLSGYTPAQPDYADEAQLDREDAAKELLTEAGYGPGLKPLRVEIRYNTNDAHKKVATAVADMWKNVLGAEATLLNTDIKTHYAHLQNKGDFDAARAGWVGDYADPQNFLFLGLTSNAVSNYSQYKNPKFDELMQKSDTTLDAAARAKLMEEAEAMLIADQPLIPLLNRTSLYLVSDKVSGWEENTRNVHRSQYITIRR